MEEVINEKIYFVPVIILYFSCLGSIICSAAE